MLQIKKRENFQVAHVKEELSIHSTQSNSSAQSGIWESCDLLNVHEMPYTVPNVSIILLKLLNSLKLSLISLRIPKENRSSS